MTFPPHDVWIGVMAKHLPPSGAALRLLDVGGHSGGVLLALRPDLVVQAALTDLDVSALPPESSDAVVIFDQSLTPALLDAALHTLRPGGRMIVVLPHAPPDASWVALLEAHGYIRILVEPALEELSAGVLVRGEKPHTTDDTLARIRVAAHSDDHLTDLDRYPGRFVYLLVRQTPNKPIWALRDGEVYRWDAVTIRANDKIAFMTFSSLAKAIAFMQPAVLAKHIRDINKVAKYRVERVKDWSGSVILNPPDGFLGDQAYSLHPIDPTQAEAPDE
jgi:SAM-dependent methyltransferase